jgi:hypothetical protein
MGTRRLFPCADYSPTARVRSRMVELYLYSPIHHHGVVPNKLSTGTTLPFFFYSYLKLSFPTYLELVIPKSNINQALWPPALSTRRKSTFKGLSTVCPNREFTHPGSRQSQHTSWNHSHMIKNIT